tara:strand:+ start:26 stop:1690 length:1665 start_codon:yes stop_codon:yes gene_type:complete
MRKFRDLVEAKDTIVFAFGRFNPPTTGHEKVIEKVVKIAGSNPYRIYPSFTTNPKKDPLPHALKIAYMRKMFKKYARNIIADKDAKTAIHIAEKLYKEGFKNLVMVAGSDRIKEFSTLLNRYNDAPDKKGNQLFKFDSVNVISAGERDPDSEGVEGMSASKMRVAAVNGDMDSFLQGVPSGFSDGKKLYRDVRKYMGIREERDMGDMTDFEAVRDAYLTGKIWNVGEIVEANGISGEVVRKGTNYLSFMTEDGKVHKAWLHEIELDEAKSALDRLRDFDKSRVAAGLKPIFKDKKDVKWVKMKKKGLMTTMNVPTDEIDKFLKKGYKIVESLDERNYAKEYQNYHSRPEQIANRSSRNKARRVMGDKTKIGMDVGHKDNNPLNNDPKNLKNEDPSKNRREPRLREKPEIDETLYINLWDKISRLRHPKGWEKLVKAYVDGMEEPEHRKRPSSWAAEVTRQHTKNVPARSLVKYINTLVAKGKLPKELKAEYIPEDMSFRDLVDQIQERELTDTELKRREEIAKDLSDADFKNRYGDRWKEVKMGVATKMAKKES